MDKFGVPSNENRIEKRSSSEEPIPAEVVGPGDPGTVNPFTPTPPPPPSSTSPTYTPSPPTSGLAISSLCLGIASLVLTPTCCIPIFTSILAIICGHIGVSKIKDSEGRLQGLGIARIGLVLGYSMLLLSVGLTLYFVVFPKASPPNEKSNEITDRLRKAEISVMSDSSGVADGNTPEAIALAQEYSKSLKKLREDFFTPDDGRGISLSGGHFVTYCELHPDKCALIVHVPSYRDYQSDAKESLAQLAWMLAQSTVSEKLEPGDQLAVGLRGTLLYGAVMIGQVGDPDYYDLEDRDDLIPFFPLPPTEDLETLLPTEEFEQIELEPEPELESEREPAMQGD